MAAPNPSRQLISHSATPEETAAIVAAVERFLREHAPVRTAAQDAQDAWRRTALLEGVARHERRWSSGGRSVWASVR